MTRPKRFTLVVQGLHIPIEAHRIQVLARAAGMSVRIRRAYAYRQPELTIAAEDKRYEIGPNSRLKDIPFTDPQIIGAAVVGVGLMRFREVTCG